MKKLHSVLKYINENTVSPKGIKRLNSIPNLAQTTVLNYKHHILWVNWYTWEDKQDNRFEVRSRFINLSWCLKLYYFGHSSFIILHSSFIKCGYTDNKEDIIYMEYYSDMKNNGI